MADAKDHLLQAKVSQAAAANANRGLEDPYLVGDQVMLSTLHRRREYTKSGELRAAKFFPRWDGPYTVLRSHPETSSYELNMPNMKKGCYTFHASELKRFVANDPSLFPGREHMRPPPVVTEAGIEEFHIERIIDARRRGRGWQFLVRWTGYGAEEDRWLPFQELRDCEALDRWFGEGGDGPESR